MNDLGIGKIITTAQQRDAIHVAVAPVFAACLLSPGEHVGFVDGATVGRVEPYVGIIDPFLKESVRKGQRCWLFVYPNTITSLRHEWTHQAFNSPSPEVEEEVEEDEDDYSCSC